MRRSNWTPSIVPNVNEETVYLVVDDLGRLGRIWREASVDHTDLETIIQDLLEGQYQIRSASLASIPSKDGRRTCQPMSPRSFDGAATCSSGTCPARSSISWNDMRGVAAGS
jgi:hypothetical protein